MYIYAVYGGYDIHIYIYFEPTFYWHTVHPNSDSHYPYLHDKTYSNGFIKVINQPIIFHYKTICGLW